MNSKVTTNSQLLTTRPHLKQQQKQTTQITGTGMEPQNWSSHGGLSTGEWEQGEEGKVQKISSINGR